MVFEGVWKCSKAFEHAHKFPKQLADWGSDGLVKDPVDSDGIHTGGGTLNSLICIGQN